MLANLFVWLIVSVLVYAVGSIVASLIKPDFYSISPFLMLIIGILPSLLFVTLWAFFYRISYEALIVYTLISIAILWVKRNKIKTNILLMCQWWHSSDIWLKISIIAFIVITALQAAKPTNIPDHGYYYLQTIKWANEVGIPIGIVRFGFQYGQFSGWHLFQALFNFSFLYGSLLNNINGWLLIVFILWLAYDLKKIKKEQHFFYGFTVLIVAILQYFNTAPSPDLPVILLSLIVFKVFLYGSPSRSNFLLMTVLTTTAILIKISAFYLVAFVIVFGLKHKLKPKFVIMLIFSSSILLLLCKNLLTTGAPFFPANLYTPKLVTWNVNPKILEDGKLIIKNSPIIDDYKAILKHFKLIEEFTHWINFPGYRGIINKLWFLGILFVGAVAIAKRSKLYFMIFSISIIHFIILWYGGANYRFAIAIIFLNYYLVFYTIFEKINLNLPKLLVPVIIILSGIWLTPIMRSILKLSVNPIIHTYYPLKPSYFITPAKPFKAAHYDKLLFNGEEVYIPSGYNYPWDGPLPCVMRNHFEKYSNYK